MSYETYLFLPRDQLKSRNRPVAVNKVREPRKVQYKTRPSGIKFACETEEPVEESPDSKQFLARSAFIQSTDTKIARQKYRRCVEQGTKEYEEKLSERREKLREMLLKEESDLARFGDLEKESVGRKKEEMVARMQEEEKRESENREKQVAAKRVQQYLARCPEVREAFSKKSTFDTKFCNLVQAEEKASRRRMEMEIECVWHDLSLKEIEAKKSREEKERRKKEESNSVVAVNLRRQISEKLAAQAEETRAREEERKRLEELSEKIHREKIEDARKRQEERQKLREDLKSQLRIAKQRLEENAGEEAALNRAFGLSSAENLKEREALKKSSVVLRNELLAFMQNLKEFREQEAKRDAEIDEVIRETAKEAEEKKYKIKVLQKEAREREFNNVLKIRAEQLKEKEERKKQEMAQRELEKKILEEQLELEERITAYNNRVKREDARRYAQELIAQREQVEIQRKREREEIEQMYDRGLEREQEYENMVKTLLNSSNITAPCNFTTQRNQLKKNIDLEISKAGIVQRIT